MKKLTIILTIAFLPLIGWGQIVKSKGVIVSYQGIVKHQIIPVDSTIIGLYNWWSSSNENYADSLYFLGTGITVNYNNDDTIVVTDGSLFIEGNSLRFASSTVGDIYTIEEIINTDTLVLNTDYNEGASDALFLATIPSVQDESDNDYHLTQSTTTNRARTLWFGSDSIRMQFDGTNDDYVMVNNNIGTVNSISFFCSNWSYATFNTVLSRVSTSNYIAFSNASSLIYRLNATNHNFGITNGFPLNEQLHIVITRNDTILQLYINGEYETEIAITQVNNIDLVLDYVGARRGSELFFNGYLDDIRIYDRVISGSQIQSMYDNRRIGQEQPIAYNPLVTRLLASSIEIDSLDFNYSGNTVSSFTDNEVTLSDNTNVFVGNSIRFGVSDTDYIIEDTLTSSNDIVLNQNYAGSLSDEMLWGGLDLWYDESPASNDFTETDSTYQPILVWGETDSAAVYFDGTRFIKSTYNIPNESVTSHVIAKDNSTDSTLGAVYSSDFSGNYTILTSKHHTTPQINDDSETMTFNFYGLDTNLNGQFNNYVNWFNYETKEFRYYWNSWIMNKDTNTLFTQIPDDKLRLGSRSAGSLGFDGYIKELNIYDTVLSYSDVSALSVYDSARQKFDNGKILISFDDGRKDVYDSLYDIMVDNNCNATFYINCHSISTAHFLTWEHIDTLLDNGFDVQDHNFRHFFMVDQTEQEIRDFFDKTDSTTTVQGLDTFRYMAYPGGLSNTSIENITSEYRLLGRDASSQSSTVYKDAYKYNMPAYFIEDHNTDEEIAELKQIILNIKETKQAAQFYLHHVGLTGDDEDPGYDYDDPDDDMIAAQFEEIVQFIDSVGIDMITISDLYPLLN